MDEKYKWRLITDGPDCDVCKYRAIIGVALRPEDGKTIGPTEIERRLNSFDELVELLEKAKSAVQWMADATDSDPEDQELLEIVNTGIAKAKGE